MTLELSIGGVGGNTTRKAIKSKGMVGGSRDTPSLKKCVICDTKTIHGLYYPEGWVCLSCDKETYEREV